MSGAFTRLMIGCMCAGIAHLYYLNHHWPATVGWSASAAIWTLNGILEVLHQRRMRQQPPTWDDVYGRKDP